MRQGRAPRMHSVTRAQECQDSLVSGWKREVKWAWMKKKANGNEKLRTLIILR